MVALFCMIILCNKDFLNVCDYSANLKSILMKYGMVNNKINIDNFIVMMMDNEMRFGAD